MTRGQRAVEPGRKPAPHTQDPASSCRATPLSFPPRPLQPAFAYPQSEPPFPGTEKNSCSPSPTSGRFHLKKQD